MPSTVEIIARRLYSAGCRHAFGIPGGEVLAMMEALDTAGIKFTLTKHENSAGFMAEGTYHATGAPGILLATVGPGIVNAVNVIANAEQDRVPLIVLSGCVDASEQLSYTHQILDHRAVLDPITKATFTAVDGATDWLIDKALTIAMEGRPGPVHIDIPISLATKDQSAPRPLPSRAPGALAPLPGKDLDEACAKLRGAKKPVMIAGLDVMNEAGGVEAVRAFVEEFQIPLLTTYKGKGILPEDHELALGGHGLSPLSDETVLPFIKSADLVLAVGYDPIEMRAGWLNPWRPENAIEIAPVLNTHYVHHAEHVFLCSITGGLAALAEGARGQNTRPWAGGEVAAAKQQLSAAFSNKSWGPNAAIAAIQRAAPGNVVVSADTGAHRILASQMWKCSEPRTMMQSSGLCTMGCALPLAMGHIIARPDAPVLAFTGDAGMEMVLGELATLRDLKLPVVIIVFVDESLALIELKQRGTGRNNLGVDFGGSDFPAIAEAMGGIGRTAGDEETLEAEIKKAFARDGFTLIAVPIGRKAYDGRI